jgi:hypothetical protein
VRLDGADDETVGEAMTMAWRHGSEKPAPRRAKAKKR